MSGFLRRVGYGGVLFFSLAGLAAGLRIFLFKILAVNMLTYQLYAAPDVFPAAWCLLAGLPALLFFTPRRQSVLKKVSIAAAPFLLGWVLPQTHYFFFPCFLILLGWGVLRLIRSCGSGLVRNHPWLYREQGELIYPWLVLTVYLLLAGWGYYMQLQASRALFLCYSDWGTYAESYIHLTSGAATWKNWLSTGSHWNPLVNVVMAGFVRLFPGEKAFFLFNSMLIYSVVPLTWIFGRKIGLLPFHAFVFTLSAAFCPVYGNLSLCLFYGFHPIYFVIPLLMLFFLCRETGNRVGMVLCLIATLLLKETMMIFWFGYGVWLLFRRRWLAGGLLAGGCLTGFCLLSSMVLPWLVNVNDYPLTFLYSSLGNTPWEVVKSPVVKPEVFWGICFQWQNFAFLATLLLPGFFCVWLYPGMMIALLPLLAGICLRGTPEIKSIVLQYGTETATVLLALSVINFNRVRRGEHSVWSRILLCGLPRSCPRILLLSALATAVLLVSMLAHYCFAQSLWGKYGFHLINNMPDESEVIRQIEEKLVPGCRVLATERLRNHFMFGHPTLELVKPRRTGDFLIFSLHDRLMDSPEKLETLRREIAADPKIIPVSSVSSNGKNFAVFKVTDGSEPSGVRPLPVVSAAEFIRIGQPLPSGNPDFSFRYLYRDNRHTFLIRLEKTPDYDVDLLFHLEGPWGGFSSRNSFGWGLFPAYSCPAGTVFVFELEAPQADKVNFYCAERKASRLKN